MPNSLIAMINDSAAKKFSSNLPKKDDLVALIIRSESITPRQRYPSTIYFHDAQFTIRLIAVIQYGFLAQKFLLNSTKNG
jgi:hypothetical protein